MKVFAIILAGGNGRRMNNAVPKQFLTLRKRPLINYSLDAFFECYPDCTLILVLPGEYFDEWKAKIMSGFSSKNILFTKGGDTRFHSTRNGLRLVGEEGIVFVHDAARCLLTPSLIRRCEEGALSYGSAIPVISCKDSIRIMDGGKNNYIDREKIRIVQTPQAFKTELLLPAFEQEYKSAFTDEASVIESAGSIVHLVEGEEDNIKITRPLDLYLAEKILDERNA